MRLKRRKEGPTTGEVHVDSFANRRKDSMGTLTTKARNDLPDSAFALPGRRYPIHDESHARNALARVAQNGNSDEQSKVKAAVSRRFPNISKMDVSFDIRKADEVAHIVTGVVLEPNLVDSQGDEVSPEEIEKAAYAFMEESQRQDIQHSESTAPTTLVESYVAPQDFELDTPNGPEPVTKGSWVQSWRIHDDNLWARCSNPDHPEALTGFSMGGSAIRI